MRDTKYLLIGGGLAASQAAKQLRKHDTAGSIVLVSQEPHVPYDRPPLSKEFLRGEVSANQLQYDSRDVLGKLGVDLMLATSVTSLDPSAKIVQLSVGEPLRFDKALIATGGRPKSLDVEGSELAGVQYLRTLDDAASLKTDAGPDRRVAIVGAGFIGMEAAASLSQLGATVFVVESASRIWAHFVDRALSEFIETCCEEKGITFYTHDTVARIEGKHRVERVVTWSGREIECDTVLIAVGIVPNVEPAVAAGLDVDDGIVVDAQLRTSHPDVFAAGDVVNFPDPIFQKRRRVEHWGHAEYSGQIAGQNMAGGHRQYDHLSYVWSDVFDLHIEFAGDETDHDRSVVRGTPGTESFTVLYLEDDRVTAFFSVNGRPREFSPLKKLIRSRVRLDGMDDRLADPDASLRELL
jgi:NADPH-dependent 2,4-dienoyl-CoA reductase/sulfur reductase-like enzyme